jgi:tRNA pseudouridine32 synthase/23S rRNA pseudouridine746 synthase
MTPSSTGPPRDADWRGPTRRDGSGTGEAATLIPAYPPAPLPDGPPPPLTYAPPLEPFLAVLHADAEIVVIDKPSGLLSVPGKPAAHGDSAQTRVAMRWPGARAVHRLDLGASGVMLFALTARALRILSGQFAKRMVDKRYVALISGAPDAEEGRIVWPLRADWPNRPRQRIAAEGKPALTEWRVLAREGAATRMALVPHTGRSHQLRVHMAALGHPLLGDPLYGEAGSAPRLMLHAERLSVRHPADGRPVTFSAPVPF